MRGEKLGIDWYAKGGVGSPPHARGKDVPAASDSSTSGITPACAGKSY